MSFTTENSKSDVRKFWLTIAVIAVCWVLALVFTGCATKPVAEPDPVASQAAAPEVVEEEAPEPEATVTGVVAFGDTITYDDNVSLSVSAPAPYTASEWAAGVVEGQQVLAFEFVITNGSDEPFDPTFVFATMASGGIEASSVFDTGEGIGGSPTTKVLPGQTVKWNQAWSVADPANLTMETIVGFEYTDAIYTNIQ